MDPAEVVPAEVEGHGRLQVLEPLTEGVGHPGETTDAHAHSEIVALHVGGTDPSLVRLAPEGELGDAPHLMYRGT